MRDLLGKFFWSIYQFLGRNGGPTFSLDLTDGLAEYFLDGRTLVYCIHHCWHCLEYDVCEYRKGNAVKPH